MLLSPPPPPAAECDRKEKLSKRILANPRIPSPPTLAFQIIQKSGQEDCSVVEIGDLLAHDPGMCAKILKTLNSAMYGLTRPVTNVRQAVNLLGIRSLRSLVLGLALPAMQAGVPADAGLRRFWRQSIAGGVMAKALALRTESFASDDDLAASLLRDLGMILLHQTFREEYLPAWEGDVELLGGDQCAWEERWMGLHHAELSAALLEQWRLPVELVYPIRFHHRPGLLGSSAQSLADRAHLLEFVGRLAELEDRCHSAVEMEGILRTARDRYGMQRADLEQFLGEVRPKIQEFSATLGVDIGECPAFDELLETGCDELVRASMEVAAVRVESGNAAGARAPAATACGARERDLIDESGNLVPGYRIHQYEVVEVLGRGAMGVVLKAHDAGLGRHVAIKLPTADMADSDNAHKRFALEGRSAAALRHENVVTIYAVSEFDGVPFLVMEYVDGSSLESLMERGRPFTVPEIASIGRQTALGLAAAHAARLVHRDIKPANLLVERDRLHVRVADFGLVRALDADLHLSQPGLLLGTPNYMSPEQVDGKALTAKSDLFSLGSVLYTLCTGRLPFLSETITGLLYAVAEKTPTPIRSLNPSIPEGLARVIGGLQAKNPDDRPVSASAVAESLRPWC